MGTQDIILDTHEFLVDTTMQAQWGRKLYRHESGQGSVIEFDHWVGGGGSRMKLFVADAKYRGMELACDTRTQVHGNPQLSVTTGYFNGSQDDRTAPLTYTKDDLWIQRTYAELKNDGTAKSNTDKLMGFDTTDAAHHCRDQDIPGVGPLDLPNLYELIILYLESDNIDALDPTVESNRTKALGKMNTNGRFTSNEAHGVWASTEAGSGHAWGIEGNGRAGHWAPYYGGLIAPVKELDA